MLAGELALALDKIHPCSNWQPAPTTAVAQYWHQARLQTNVAGGSNVRLATHESVEPVVTCFVLGSTAK